MNACVYPMALYKIGESLLTPNVLPIKRDPCIALFIRVKIVFFCVTKVVNYCNFGIRFMMCQMLDEMPANKSGSSSY